MADFIPLDYSNESLQKRINTLWEYIWALQEKIKDLSNNVEEKKVTPYTKSGGNKDIAHSNPIDISTGMGTNLSGAVIWNDAELKFIPYGEKPTLPTKGYNRHSHSRFSGGALDIKTLEIIEYNINWNTTTVYNKDCQSLWKIFPSIKTEKNSKNENVNKVGLLDLIFNADTLKWGTSAYEIDVKKCYLVLRDEDGNIEKDENGKEKKALLYNEDETKTNIVWDKFAKCWRLLAIYAEEPEE